MNVDAKFTLERALLGYDAEFSSALVKVITEAIFHASVVSVDGQNVAAVRTGETIDALVTCLAAVMAGVAAHDNPAVLRKNCKTIARRLQKQAAQARAAGDWDWAGGARGGRA
jgi:hypothetical protein